MTVIRAHWDADGLISAYMTSFGIKASKIDIGLYSKGFGATYDLSDDDYMVDMRPQDPKWGGVCIDHHPDHPSIAERRYSLIWGTKPASILSWEKFKDKIPEKEWWKVMIGAIGDGQPEKIPFEIWDAWPELMQKHKTFIKFSYGEWKVSYRPAYQLLSSGINAFARYGEFDTALRLIKKAKTPADIINNPEINAQKNKLSNTTSGDFAKIMEKAEIYPMKDLTLCIFNSPNIRISGYVASVLQSSKDNTCVLAINEDNGSLSLRGDTANYIKGKLNKLDYVNIDGHDGFCGGHIDKHPKYLYKELLEIL